MADTERAVPVLRAHAIPLPDPDEPDLAASLDSLGAARVVLLGEATHGTTEFYRARAAITRHLIERHGFTAVAIEGDWPDAAQVDAFVRGRTGDAAEPAFARFPTWMWRNEEVAAFVGWLRRWNEQAAVPGREVGFHGLDLYSMGASIEAVLRYLDEADPAAAREARANYRCLAPWMRNPAGYGRAALSPGFATCEAKALATLRTLLERRLELVGKDGRAFFDAAQNARLVANAERYYRAMYQGSRESWNLRDRHMFETLQLAARGQAGHARRGLGAQLAHRRRAGDGDGPLRRAEPGPALPRGARRGGPAGGLRHRPGHGGGRRRLGRAGADQARAPVAAGQRRTGLPRHGSAALPPADRRVRRGPRCAAGGPARARHRRRLPAGDRALEPLLRRVASGTSSTTTCGSTRPGR